MADAGVTGVVTKLGELAAAEATALLKVDNEIRVLRRKLGYLQALIRGAERQRRGRASELLLLWVQETREVAFEVEDAVDEFHLKVETFQTKAGGLAKWRRNWYRAAADLLSGLSMQIVVRRGLSSQIMKINERISEINQNKETYKIENSPSEILSSSSTDAEAEWDEDEYLEGSRDIPFAILKGHILNHQISRRAVVSVVGVSGIGKTTLARKLYNDRDIKKHFEVHVWIFLPPHIRFADYVDIMYNQASSQVPEAPEKGETASFAPDDRQTTEKERKLLRHLQDRRYLVVLDGLVNMSDWNILLDVLPDDNKGSRILLTTRLNVKELKYTDQLIPPFELSCFGFTQSEQLFCRRVLGVKEQPVLGMKEEPGTLRCKVYCDSKAYCDRVHKISTGLPLAVIVLSGVLRSKVIPSEWDEVFEQLEPNGQPKPVKSIWSFAFDDLPHHLKSCFLYFAAMPENVFLDADRLVRLWIAEGFVMPKKAKTLEEVALDYLKELISRGLVQVMEKGVGGGIKLVCVHELLHAFVQSEAQESAFLEIHHRASMLNPNTVRRLALHNYVDSFVHIPDAFPKLRSLLCDFAEDQGSGLDSEEHLHPQTLLSNLAQLCLTACGLSESPGLKRSHGMQFLRGSRFLRVIDLYGLKLQKLPTEIGNIIHLRYLGIRHCNLVELPLSISKLDNLQTLDLRRTNVNKAVDEFWEIEGLRHVLAEKLLLSKCTVALNHLKTLEGVVPSGPWDEKSCPLNYMIHLRSLALSSLSSSHTAALSVALKKLEFLVKLKLAGDVLPSSILNNLALRRLQVLVLHGRLEGLDTSARGRYALPNLTTLCLRSSELSQQFIDKLAMLPCLAEMELLDGSYSEKTLVFPENGFQSLERLNLKNLDKLEECVVEPGAMPMLSNVIMYDCANMKTLQGFQDSEHLQEVVVYNMPEIVDTMEREDKKVFDKMKCLTTFQKDIDRGFEGFWTRKAVIRVVSDDVEVEPGAWCRAQEIGRPVDEKAIDDIEVEHSSGAWIRSFD